MKVFIQLFHDMVIMSFEQLREFTFTFGPRVLFALLVILFGWIFALLARKIISKALKFLGFDVFAEKFGIKKLLERGEVYRSPSSILALIFYWLIILNAFIMASEVMDFGLTVELMRKTMMYMPKVAVFVIIIAVGLTVGKFADRLISRAAMIAKLPFSALIGKTGGYITLSFAFLLALDYLGVSRTVSAYLSIAIILIFPMLFLLMLLTGGKETISNITSSKFTKKEYKAGDIVEAETFSGEILSTGLFAVTLRNKNEEILIPNSIFTQIIVRRKIS